MVTITMWGISQMGIHQKLDGLGWTIPQKMDDDWGYIH